MHYIATAIYRPLTFRFDVKEDSSATMYLLKHWAPVIEHDKLGFALERAASSLSVIPVHRSDIIFCKRSSTWWQSRSLFGTLKTTCKLTEEC